MSWGVLSRVFACFSKESDHIFTLRGPLIILVQGFPLFSCGYLGICWSKKKWLWNQSLSTFNKYPNTHPQTKHFSLDPCVFSVTDRVFVHFSEGFLPKFTPFFFVQRFPTFWGCLRDCRGICRNPHQYAFCICQLRTELRSVLKDSLSTAKSGQN